MSRLRVVLLFASCIITPLFLYLGWSLNSVFGWSLTALLFVLVFSFPFVRLGPVVNQLRYLAMAYLSYLVIFVVLKDLLRLIGYRGPPSWAYGAAVASLVLGYLIAYQGPRLVKLRLPVAALPVDLEGFKIIHISDLHVGPTIRRGYVEKVVETVNQLSPDLIALTGDIGDGPVDLYRDDIAPFLQLRSKFGVFYVPGNHENYWNANEWMNVMNNLKAIVLLNRGKMISVNETSVLVAGVSDPAGHPKPDPSAALRTGEEANYKILLSHRPGIAAEASKLGFDLLLSGHTHGGQFFPWTIVVRFVHKYFQGQYLIDRMWLNVNTGTGTWGPFLRLGTTSEITQIELYRSDKSLE